MKLFTIHEPPLPSKNRIERAISLKFIKYGFSWGAFFFSPFYFIFKSEWLGLFFYFLSLFLFVSLITILRINISSLSPYLILVHVIFGFEASSLQRLWLRLRGWREIGSITGHNKDECERSYFNEFFSDKSPDICSNV